MFNKIQSFDCTVQHKQTGKIIKVALDVDGGPFSDSIKSAYAIRNEYLERKFPDYYLIDCYSSECFTRVD